MTYEFNIIDDHIIFLHENKKILLDTGAPNSISNDSDFVFLGKVYRLTNNYLGFSLDKLSSFIGADIDVLLGADILRNHTIQIDWVKKKLLFDNVNQFNNTNSISIKDFMNIPILTFELNKNYYNAFFDTGAKISYMHSDICKYYTPKNSAKDFYPGFGEFETNLYQDVINIERFNLELTFGNLPLLLEMSLMLANAQGIIGNDLCKKYKVSLSISQKRIILEKY